MDFVTCSKLSPGNKFGISIVRIQAVSNSLFTIVILFPHSISRTIWGEKKSFKTKVPLIVLDKLLGKSFVDFFSIKSHWISYSYRFYWIFIKQKSGHTFILLIVLFDFVISHSSEIAFRRVDRKLLAYHAQWKSVLCFQFWSNGPRRFWIFFKSKLTDAKFDRTCPVYSMLQNAWIINFHSIEYRST